MEVLTLHKEEENRQKGIIISVAIHLLLLLFCLMPYMAMQDPPQELGGITVAFGAPDSGSSSANPKNTDPTPVKEVAAAASTKPIEKVKPKEEAPKPKSTPSKSKPIEVTSKSVSDESVIIAKQAEMQKAAEAQAKATAAENARIEAAKAAQAEAEKRAAEAVKQAALDAKKGQFSDLLGSGKGQNNNSGTQGDPKGDPDSDALQQIATGSGRIGGGLKNRGVLFEPEINDSSQKTGKVVIKVCVDTNGKISEAKFTQRGSTTTDKYLVDIATKAARQYKFTPSDVDTQCGSITIEFKVK